MPFAAIRIFCHQVKMKCRCVFFPLLFSLTACSTVHIKVTPPATPSATRQPLSLSIPSPSNTTAYNQKVRQALDFAALNGFRDSVQLGIGRSGSGTWDPSAFKEVVPAGDISIQGISPRTATSGVGVPVVLWAPKDSGVFAGQPGIPDAGLAFPATAILVNRSGIPCLEFRDTMKSDRTFLEGRERSLATDFSAPLAYAIAKGQNRTLDFNALFDTKSHLAFSGLYQLQNYDPNKIPVVFVHGLLCRPEAWTAATNQLLADPRIRKRYQFWYYRYPTGLPIWASAAKLRSELDRFNATLDPRNSNPRMREKVLVGHSMGGLISDLMIRRGGAPLWGQFFRKDPNQIAVKSSTREKLRNFFNFEGRSDVAEVIFVATPHRGSPLAERNLAGFLAGLIKLPALPLNTDIVEIRRTLRDSMRPFFNAPANGISCLKARSPILISILNLPMDRNITYYSVIGDEGKVGPIDKSSDGVVPYWSSHLNGAASEKIVPSGHGVNEDRYGIAEIDRILNGIPAK